MAEYECASCEDRVCREGVDCYDAAERVKQLYIEADPECIQLLQTAAKVEAEGYMRWPRALEIIRFAQKAGFTHLGVAFCIGLAEEARTYVDLLTKTFEVSSVCCKVCGVFKEEFKLAKLRPDGPNETMCSPLGQAALLNEAGTQLNIVMGLCVGHDALFARQSKAPVTTLIAKDRVLAHNPSGALYSRYWRKVLREKVFTR
ncbi:MAG: DUF1847 domain-containing protein [Deltaproteobacteria bacterium]|nr:DUF1847 domain-containing protein [Deltaproteobacteria bacterium]